MYNQFSNPLRPKDIVEERKAVSDIKNDTNDLFFENGNNDARAKAHRKVRDKKYSSEINTLKSQTDEDELLAELEKLEQDYIDS